MKLRIYLWLFIAASLALVSVSLSTLGEMCTAPLQIGNREVPEIRTEGSEHLQNAPHPEVDPAGYAAVVLKAREAKAAQENRSIETDNAWSDPRNWWRQFLCGVKASDVATGVFTFALVFIGSLQVQIYRNQAHIMHEQLRTTRSIERAFLSIEGLGVTETTGGKPIARIHVTNNGALPATRIWWTIDADIDTAQRRTFCLDEDGATKDSTNLLAPKASMDRNFACRPFTKWNDFQAADPSDADRLVLYVWGVVHYLDGFKQDRWTRFCFRYDNDGIAVGRVDGYAGTGVSRNSARQHQWGNSTEDDAGA